MKMSEITKMLAEIEKLDDWYNASEDECKAFYQAFKNEHSRFVQAAVNALCRQNRKAPKVSEVKALLPAIRAKMEAKSALSAQSSTPKEQSNKLKRELLANSPDPEDVKKYQHWKSRFDSANKPIASIDEKAYEYNLARKGIFRVYHPHPYGEFSYTYEKIGKNIGNKTPITHDDFWECLGIFGSIIKRLGNEAAKHARFFESYPFLKQICLNIGYGKIMNAAVNERNHGLRDEEIYSNFKEQFIFQTENQKQA